MNWLRCGALIMQGYTYLQLKIKTFLDDASDLQLQEVARSTAKPVHYRDMISILDEYIGKVEVLPLDVLVRLLTLIETLLLYGSIAFMPYFKIKNLRIRIALDRLTASSSGHHPVNGLHMRMLMEREDYFLSLRRLKMRCANLKK